MTRLRAAWRPAWLLLGGILAGGLALRLASIDYGLPYVYTHDEASHFTARAISMFRQDLDPGYYENPSTFTYLVFLLLRVQYGLLGRFFELPRGNVTDQFVSDPTSIWISARTLAAVLGMFGVLAVYTVGRRLWGVREGLLAAAVLAFAFLPLTYSRVAVTDIGVLVGVAGAVYGACRVADDGQRRYYLLAGAMAGLAISFKYTAGLVLLPLGIACLLRLRRDRLQAVLSLALGVALAAVVFVALNPHLFVNFSEFRRRIDNQATVASSIPKAGQEGGAVTYYLDSLTWGFGWLPILAASAGLLVVAVRDRGRAIVLAAFPVALFVYLSLQSRYFGRWLLPAYPVLALLAAVAIGRAADLLTHRRAALAPATAALLCVVVMAQPLFHGVRSTVVIAREDTREQARRWLVDHYPAELRIVVEPAIPDRWYRASPKGVFPNWLRRCEGNRFSYVRADGKRVCTAIEPGQFSRPANKLRSANYHYALSPKAIDDYRFYGYCYVMTMGLVRERTEKRKGKPQAYYRRLERESNLVRSWSPWRKGKEPQPFHFDLSYNYYSSSYARPGPDIRLYKLRGCRPKAGAPVIRVPKTPDVPIGAPPEDA